MAWYMHITMTNGSKFLGEFHDDSEAPEKQEMKDIADVLFRDDLESLVVEGWPHAPGIPPQGPSRVILLNPRELSSIYAVEF